MAINLEGGGGKALMTWPLVEELFFCGFPKPVLRFWMIWTEENTLDFLSKAFSSIFAKEIDEVSQIFPNIQGMMEGMMQGVKIDIIATFWNIDISCSVIWIA